MEQKSEVIEMRARDNLKHQLFNILVDAGCMNEDIKSRIIIEMDKYEITERCTDIVPTPYEQNEKLLQKFSVAKAVAGSSKKTIFQYIYTVRKLIHRCNKALIDINSDDISLYLAYRKAYDGVTDTTIANERKNISAFFSWLERTDEIPSNPVRKIDRIKVPKIHKKAFNDIEVERIRCACKTLKEKAVVEMLLSTGCRVAEMVSIRTCDIDGNRIMVRGKGNKYRQVYLNARSQIAVSSFIRFRNDNNPFLFNSRTTNIHMSENGIRAMLKRLEERCDVENIHPHRFRRTCATMSLHRGMPIEQVSKMLGHENIATTQIYLDLDERELEYMHQKYVI